MRTRLGFLRNKYALLALAAGVLAIVVWGLYPRPAYGQGNMTTPDRVYSAGPFQLHYGERVLTGLPLPAVQQNGKTASPLATSMQSFNTGGGTMTHLFFGVFANAGPI
jgi:hypothetical protein